MGSVELGHESPLKQARVGAGRQTKDLFLLSRPAHWAKSVLAVPIALVDPKVWSWSVIDRVVWSTVAFILASAVVYLVNDIVDQRFDQRHPSKRQRPIAAGRVSATGIALYGAVLTGGLGLLLAFAPHGNSWAILGYLGLNFAYSGGVKHLPLIDVGVVSAGFVLRVVQGYVATTGPIPGWLLIAVFSGSLLLILGKRRRELLDVGVEHRPSLRGYSVEFVNHLQLLTGVLCLTATLVYLRTEAPIAPHGQAALLISVPFVLYALSRYLQVILVLQGGGDPVRLLLRDRALIAAMGIWSCLLAALVIMTHFPNISSIYLP